MKSPLAASSDIKKVLFHGEFRMLGDSFLLFLIMAALLLSVIVLHLRRQYLKKKSAKPPFWSSPEDMVRWTKQQDIKFLQKKYQKKYPGCTVSQEIKTDTLGVYLSYIVTDPHGEIIDRTVPGKPFKL